MLLALYGGTDTLINVQAGSMDWQDEGGVGRRAQSITQALDEVERFPPPEATLQTQHYITEARSASLGLGL